MNLIICHTPLQVVIAEKIIALHPNEPFYGVMIYPLQNAKYEYYAKRLKTACDRFLAIKPKTGRVSRFIEIIQLKSTFKQESFDKVFAASINEMQIQFILSSTHFQQLYTFDDGSANIVPSSCYYIDEPNTFIRRWTNRLLRNKYNVRKIKSISQGHYTIYPNLPNIIENTIPIDLFSCNQTEQVEGKTINILLGQPVYTDQQQNIDLAEKVIKRFDIDYYLPHPREQYQLTGVEYIQTPLIFEDYMAQHFANKACRVYTYFSSAVLNIKSANIEVIGLHIHTDNPAFNACYTLLANAGIPIIDMRE